uniref:Phospholipid scramblase n=1 Tax=Plectus sambesii TaxID=2011161 RepID=A0A914WKF3_9BILA
MNFDDRNCLLEVSFTGKHEMHQNMHYDPNSQPPITMQPGVPGTQPWMQAPQVPIGCPPGLEYLTQVDQVLCHQIVELLQAFTGWESNNKYAIKNSMGQQIYYVFEETDCCMRMCCSNSREFTLHIVNNYNQEVMRVYRPLKVCAGCCWCAGCCDCCAQETQIEAPPGVVIGRVKQTGGKCNYNYEIQDTDGNAQLRIEGPCIMCRCCSDVEFPVYTMDGAARVGCVTKQWTGLVREAFTTADNFGISFPMDLDVKTKATLLGAMFLIDFMAFENQPKNNN